MNCSHCGAPINYGDRCIYCDCIYPVEIRIKYNNISNSNNLVYENVCNSLQQRLNDLNANMANTIQTQYLLNIMGKWTATSPTYIY